MDLVEYPQLPQMSSHMWAVKTVSHVHTPKFILVGLQTNRKNVMTADSACFDSCHISELRLHLNSQIYPYNMSELNIGSDRYSELYGMYTRIQSSYYSGTEPRNMFAIGYGEFQRSRIVRI